MGMHPQNNVNQNSLLFEALPYSPLLFSRKPNVRSPCYYQGELWLLSGWGWEHTNKEPEPLARYDGTRWHFYSQPSESPSGLLCSHNTLMVVDDTSRIVYYSQPDQTWQRADFPKSSLNQTNMEIHFSSGASIIAHDNHQIWQWHAGSWNTLPSPLTQNQRLITVIPKTTQQWYLITAENLGSSNKIIEDDSFPEISSLDRAWSLIKQKKLNEARFIITTLLKKYPHNGQLLFADARLLWLEKKSPEASMQRTLESLTQAHARFGKSRLFNLYGVALTKLNRAEESLTWFKKAVDAFPEAIYLDNLAETTHNIGDTVNSLLWARRAVAAGSSNTLTHQIVGTHEPDASLQNRASNNGELWHSSIYAVRPDDLIGTATPLKKIESRTFISTNGPIAPHHLESDGRAVWPDDISTHDPVRHTATIYNQTYTNNVTLKEDFLQPLGTVIVRSQKFSIVQEGERHDIDYIPYVQQLRDNNKGERQMTSLSLKNSYWNGEYLYLPIKTSDKNTQIVRFSRRNATYATMLGILKGEPTPIILDKKPAWQLLKKTDKKNQASYYHIDTLEPVNGNPKLAESELIFRMEGLKNFIKTDQGIHLRQQGQWINYSYATLGIPMILKPRHFNKPGAREHRQPNGSIVMVAENTLWFFSRENNEIWVYNLERLGKDPKKYSLEEIQMTLPVGNKKYEAAWNNYNASLFITDGEKIHALKLPNFLTSTLKSPTLVSINPLVVRHNDGLVELH